MATRRTKGIAVTKIKSVVQDASLPGRTGVKRCAPARGRACHSQSKKGPTKESPRHFSNVDVVPAGSWALYLDLPTRKEVRAASSLPVAVSNVAVGRSDPDAPRVVQIGPFRFLHESRSNKLLLAPGRQSPTRFLELPLGVAFHLPAPRFGGGKGAGWQRGFWAIPVQTLDILLKASNHKT
jgi:hypothetical protein